MNYDEAYNRIFNDVEYNEADKLLDLIAKDSTIEGIEFIQQITKCSLNDAKLLWVELKCQFGTEETNPFMKKSTLTPQQIAHNNAVAREWQNKPKCPTCNSQNLKKISTTSKAVNTIAFGIFGTKRNKTFKCLNCGYEW